MNFSNKVVIITGSSSGIGKAAALCFAKHSANVVISGRNEKRLKEVAKLVQQKGVCMPLTIRADVTKDDDVKKIVEETVQHFGQIDVVVNNAGSGALAQLKDGIETYDKMMSTNLRSAYLMSHLVLPYLKRSKGNIINVSSIAACKPLDNLMAYCISKAGMNMLTRACAVELGPLGIRVNSVNPGPVMTDFFDQLGMGEKKIDEFLCNWRKVAPLGKHAKEEEVAKLITFLASDNAQSITGGHYVIDNGFAL